MWQCENCGEKHEDQFDSCWKCAGERYNHDLELDFGKIDIGYSTTSDIPGKQITKSLGIVFGEAILGANIVSDILASFTDFLGGRSGAYEEELQDARQIALYEMSKQAYQKGANAVVGVKLDYETIRGSMIMVTATGTAVIAEDNN